MRSAVTVAVVPEARKGPFVFHEDLPAATERAAALGYDAIELFAPGPEAVPAATLRPLLAANGVALAAVGTGAGWLRHQLLLTSPDEAIRRRAVEFIAGMIRYGAEFGAPAIIGSMQGKWDEKTPRDQALGWLRAGLSELGEVARQAGTILMYEPLNRYETNLCNTVAAGVELLNSLETGNVKLLADLFHMNIEEADIPAALIGGGAAIGHLHFVDSNRRPVGDGHLQVGPIIAALHEIEYNGYLSAEAFPWPDSDAAAVRTITAYRQWIGD